MALGNPRRLLERIKLVGKGEGQRTNLTWRLVLPRFGAGMDAAGREVRAPAIAAVIASGRPARRLLADIISHPESSSPNAIAPSPSKYHVRASGHPVL
jgi:hypothetical protein